jgi:hypothetical protein
MKLHSMILTLPIAVIIFACSESPKSTTEKPVMEETWVNLLDNNSLKGWHIYNAPDSVSTAWVNSNGILHLDASRKNENGKIFGGGNLVTDEDYENFHLKLEWRISPGGNSGIVVLCKRRYHL